LKVLCNEITKWKCLIVPPAVAIAAKISETISDCGKPRHAAGNPPMLVVKT